VSSRTVAPYADLESVARLATTGQSSSCSRTAIRLGFDRLYAALPPEFRASIVRLSPLADADRLRAPVEIASAPHDKYFPVGETRALVRAYRHSRVRLTVTSTLHHAVPHLSLSDLADLLRFDGWAVRSLRGLRG
jgi:fermentation-respiration switch protein FrsA (DUF1100 family)